MKIPRLKRVVLCGAITCLVSLPAGAELISYWPLNESSDAITGVNAVNGGANAELFGGAAFVEDFERGRVLQFDGVSGSYADAGTMPALGMESDFTWSFWVRNDEPAPTPPAAASNNVILGNRYNFNDADYDPREFIKFTPHQFEWHHDTIGENIDYVDVPQFQWTYLTVVKNGNHLFSFRNGVLDSARTITAAPINEQPFFMGGNRNVENWTGALDDVALWTNALSFNTVLKLYTGDYTPLTAPSTSEPPPVYVPVFTENFSGGIEGNWNVSDRGLEAAGFVGYDAPDTTDGAVRLGGTTTQEYWYGNSIESIERFESNIQSKVSVDRVSLEGSGTAYRSSIWIWGDDGHYLHFSHNVGETGWSYNARDDGGMGTRNPTGSGVNIPGLDTFDASFGEHKITLEIVPSDLPGSVSILMYLDDMLVGGHGFTNFPSEFQVILTGQARAAGDSVQAVFDNLIVEQVPEPTTAAMLLGIGAVGLGFRRRRS